MDNERLYGLLIKAISALIDEEVMNTDIKDSIGATEEEWEELMENF